MSPLTRLIGFLCIANAVVVAGWWVATDQPHRKAALAVSLLAVGVGAFLVLRDRATELVVGGVGTIRAAAEQVAHDAKVVGDVRARVEAQSATIHLVAGDAESASKLADRVSQKTEAAEKKIDDLTVTLLRATTQLEELRQATDFATTVLAAQNDDRRAFDRLETWAKDPTFRLRREAAASWAAVMDEHARPVFVSGFTVPWREGVVPSRLGLAELRQEYAGMAAPAKPALIEYVWNRQDIPKQARMAFLADVLRDDPSLDAVEYAGRLLAGALKLKLKPLAVQPLLQAWQERKGPPASPPPAEPAGEP